MVEAKVEETKRFLNPDYEPSGIVSNVSTAIGLINEANLRVPCPYAPKCNLDNWRRVIDMLSTSIISEVAERLDDYDLSNAFRALDLKVSDNPQYSVSDIITIKTGKMVSKPPESVDHVSTVFEHCISQLPPVTASLVGGFLSEIYVYEEDNYYENMLPDEKRFGGLNRPYRRCIEVTEGCYCRIDDNPENYPCYTSSFTCTVVHEIGHTVHNLYGFLRPGDHGYEYPDSEDSIDSTGAISPLDLTERQAEFVHDMFRSYVYNHMDCYNNPHRTNYGQEHPTESFACAFEVLLRNGDGKIMDDYWHFHDVFSHLI